MRNVSDLPNCVSVSVWESSQKLVHAIDWSRGNRNEEHKDSVVSIQQQGSKGNDLVEGQGF